MATSEGTTLGSTAVASSHTSRRVRLRVVGWPDHCRVYPVRQSVHPAVCFVSSLSPLRGVQPKSATAGPIRPSYERFERRPIRHVDDPIQEGEGVEQHGPDVLVPSPRETGCQIEIVREGHEARDGGGPGVVDEIKSLGDGESIDAGVQ